ncbi:uncharacterized protein LOC135361352 [Latimeria chalumnae]|uniref:uncharacterized protein LOC135361352 n=1 Tax=Latimeria chalumnae TaxID=7897 RepID=UPI00313A82B7
MPLFLLENPNPVGVQQRASVQARLLALWSALQMVPVVLEKGKLEKCFPFVQETSSTRTHYCRPATGFTTTSYITHSRCLKVFDSTLLLRLCLLAWLSPCPFLMLRARLLKFGPLGISLTEVLGGREVSSSPWS